MGAWDTVLGNRCMESLISSAHSLSQIEESQIKLRDYLACQALNGLLACPGTMGSYDSFARQAYGYADAMLKIRNEGGRK